MANAITTIKRVEFILDGELTYCNVFYTSNEPGTPWGGGWKTKSFPKSKIVMDILKDDVSDYLMWNDGRDGVSEGN